MGKFTHIFAEIGFRIKLNKLFDLLNAKIGLNPSDYADISVSYGKKITVLPPGACTIELITAVIYAFL